MWATHYIKLLEDGHVVQFRPRGNSMTGKVESGQLCTVEPIKGAIHKNDIVLCKVSGKQYLHLVSAISGDRYQISNNKGHINGWISIKSIFGKLIKIEP